MKIFIKLILGLIVLLFIAVIGLAVVFDPNEYKGKIIDTVKEKTGRELSIPGEISLSFVPWIGVDLGKVELSNAKGFAKHPFAKMEHLQVRAKFWSLFKLKLEADTIVIEGLKLNLAKNQQGVSNWDDLAQKPAQTPAKTGAPSTTQKQQPAKAGTQKQGAEKILAAIALNGLEIKNAQFSWDDQQTRQKIIVSDVQLSIGELKADTKIPFSTSFFLKEKSLNTKVSFSSALIFSADLKRFSFYDTQLSSDIKLATLKPRLSPKVNSALMHLDLEKQTFETKALNLSEGDITLQTQLSVKELLKTPYLNGQVTIQTFNPRVLAKRFEITLPDTEDSHVLTKASAQLNLSGSFENMNLTNLELQLDDSQLVGNAIYKPMPAISSVKLAIDNINIDRYLPKGIQDAPTTGAAKATQTKTTSGPEPVLIPLGLLTAINANADFKVGKIQVMKTHWKDFHIAANSKNGLVVVKPLSMSGYDAKARADLKLRATKSNAFISGNFDLQNFKAGKLLNDFLDKDKLKGLTSITASFNTSGIKLSQLKQNLNGNLKLNLKDGTLKGFDLDHQKNVLDAKIKRQPEPKAPVPAETKIASLSASAIIKKGVLSNKDLRAATPLARVIGQGTVDIAKERLNYTASVKFTSATDIKYNKPFEKMSAIPLDIRVTGTFANPRVKPDFEKALKTLVKKEIKKEQEKAKDKLKKKLENKVKDKLKDLFKF